MSLDSIGSPQVVITARDDELNRAIIAKSVAIGSNLADEFKTQMVLLVRNVVNITPPASGKANKGAYEAGIGAINRDLSFMGFVPVIIKEYRRISHVPAGNIKGRPAIPIPIVAVQTRMNPKFADPDAFHHARLIASGKPGRHGTASRGGKQAFYVARDKFLAMRKRLYLEIGKLAAPWLSGLRAINNGELPSWVPAWISRHEADQIGRAHYTFNFDPKLDKMFIHLVNSMPSTADSVAADTQRRIESAKTYRINFIRRGLEGRAKRIASQKS